MRIVCTLMLALPLAANLSAGSNSSIAGDYVEARSGEVYTCGCLYSSEQVTAGREAILAWDIRDGEFHGASLTGVKVAAVVVGQGNLGLAATSRRSILYLDSASSSAQQQAAADLVRDRYGAALGEIVAVHTAPISFKKDNDNTYVRVGETVNLVVRDARLPQDAHPGSTLWYGPFIPMNDSVLANTLYYRFWGTDFALQWWTSEPGITGYIGSFVIGR